MSQVLTFDYLGALAVSIAFPLLLVPQLGLIRTGLLFGLLNAAVAVWALWLFRARAARASRAHALACALTRRRAGRGASPAPTASRRWAEDRFYHDPIVYARPAPYQRIVVTRGRAGMRLFLNGNLQFPSRDEYRYHEALVHPGAGGARRAAARCWCSAAATAWRCARCCKLPERRAASRWSSSTRT